MAVNIPLIDGKVAVRLVASNEHESGWIDTLIGNHINDVQVGNERLKLDAQPTDTLSLGLSAWHSSYESGGFTAVQSELLLCPVHCTDMPDSNAFQRVQRAY